MTKHKLSTFTVAATYIGTVVGAGFASGQEVLQFFGFYGPVAYVGLVLSTLFFIFFGWRMLELGLKLKAESHLPVVKYAVGAGLGVFIDWVITAFLFGALTVMAAGAGSLFAEQFGLSPLIGSTLLLAATLVTVLLGVGSVIKSISFVVPLLLAAVLFVGIWVIATVGLSGLFTVAPAPQQAAGGHWIMAGMLYVSYNLVLSIAVLAPLGKEANSERAVRSGALWGGLGLGVGATVMVTAILLTLAQASQFEVPMIYLSGLISPTMQMVYSGVLFAEVYTTAVGSLYGFVARLSRPGTAGVRWYSIAAVIGAFAFSRLGFVNLIRILLPVVGYIGLLLLGGLAYRFVAERYSGRLGPVPAAKPEHEEGDR